MKVLPKNRGEAIAFAILGPILALPSAYYLFVRLQVLRAPGLIHHFPQVYIVLASLIVSGIFFFVTGSLWLARHRSR